MESGYSSKLDVSCIFFTVGLIGALSSFFINLLQSISENHLCSLMSLTLLFRQPYCFVKSGVRNFFVKDLAFLS